MMSTKTDSPRIYVASLADYNAGRLHGTWIDADQSAEDIEEEAQAMLKESKEPIAEEWAIHDYEGFGSLSIHEYEDFEAVAKMAEGISEHGEAWAAFVGHMGGIEYAGEFEEAYCGEWDSEEAYAEDMFRQCYEIPDFLDMYIDWESVARDMFINDNWSEDAGSGSIWVFRHI